MHKFLFTSLILLFSSSIFSQAEAKKMAEPGTYQLIRVVIPKIQEEVFTTDLLYTIESNRDQEKEIILKIGQYTSVRILPKRIINAPGFVPLPKEIVFVDENGETTEK